MDCIMSRFFLIAISGASALFPLSIAKADIFVDGTTVARNLGQGVLASGTLSGSNPSAFNNNFLVWNTQDTTSTTTNANAVSLSELDLVEVSGVQFLRLALDAQEAGKAKAQITITNLVINVFDETDTAFSSPFTVWDFSNDGSNNIVINDDTTVPDEDLTLTPLGNGADVAFLIPRSLFIGTDFIGADKLKITVSGLSDRDNGSDEFDLYTGSDAVFLGANDLVALTAVPEPSSTILLVTSIGFALLRRRKSK